jgi:antitoxin ChpS
MLDLRPGAVVGITVDCGNLIVKPRRRPHYTLSQLLATCDTRAARPRKDRKWVDDKPVGRELI